MQEYTEVWDSRGQLKTERMTIRGVRASRSDPCPVEYIDVESEDEVTYEGELIKKIENSSSGAGVPALQDYIIHISLVGIVPPVWRRVRVPANINLSVLSDKVILPVMGWARNRHVCCAFYVVVCIFIFLVIIPIPSIYVHPFPHRLIYLDQHRQHQAFLFHQRRGRLYNFETYYAGVFSLILNFCLLP